jgi:hypothetical protein
LLKIELIHSVKPENIPAKNIASYANISVLFVNAKNKIEKK